MIKIRKRYFNFVQEYCFLKDLNFYVNELDIHGGILLKEDIITAAPSYIRSLYKRVGFCCGGGGMLGGNLAVFFFFFYLKASQRSVHEN